MGQQYVYEHARYWCMVGVLGDIGASYWDEGSDTGLSNKLEQGQSLIKELWDV